MKPNLIVLEIIGEAAYTDVLDKYFSNDLDEVEEINMVPVEGQEPIDWEAVDGGKRKKSRRIYKNKNTKNIKRKKLTKRVRKSKK
jgi:hypothetical protein